MKELEANVRKISMEGLTWGGSKLVPVGYGIKKLQINLVVEDEKVSIDELQQRIEEDEEHVQSTDVVSSLDAPVSTQILLLTCLARHAKAVIDKPFCYRERLFSVFLMLGCLLSFKSYIPCPLQIREAV
jgi:translation elongation factor EF-1beta